MKAIQHRIEYVFYWLLILLTGLFPAKSIYWLGKAFGLLLYYGKVRRKVVERNLDIAFGKELNERQRRTLARNSYINAAVVMFEFLYMKRIKKEDLQRYITLSGTEILSEALQEEKGAIVAGNHFGNWELVTAAISQFSHPLYIFSGMQKNLLIDEEINRIRQKFGTHTISKAKSAAFEMMKVLKKNKPLGMAGDLNVPHDNLFVDFFGKKAVVGQGLATFALKRKSPLIFIWNVRVAPFKYQGFIKRIDYQSSANTQKDLQQLAQSISTELEMQIRQHPDQYFWFNRRWKTRPPEDPEDVY